MEVMHSRSIHHDCSSVTVADVLDSALKPTIGAELQLCGSIDERVPAILVAIGDVVDEA
jgi:hypothetical protein